MRKNPLTRIAALFLAAVMLAGCFGPMKATTRLRTWNREIENRWAGEGLYLLLRIPYGGVYGVFALSDFLIWNSIEFWGGTNPIAPVSRERLERVRELDARRHGGGRNAPQQ
jgi:hypothetical protein